ncbi:MAG: penicillin-binding protein 2 [Patescibacteria group bacterium]
MSRTTFVRTKHNRGNDRRLIIIKTVFFLFGLTLVGRLFELQILKGKEYSLKAEEQYSVRKAVEAPRGLILVHEHTQEDRETELFAIARNINRHLIYAIPKDIENFEETIGILSPLLGITNDELSQKLKKPLDPFEPLVHGASDEMWALIQEQRLRGIGEQIEYSRDYPEGMLFGTISGFVQGEGDDRRGQYGIEQAYDEILKGVRGLFDVEQDAKGNVIPIGREHSFAAVPGSDIVLTLDHAIQYRACEQLDNAVKLHGAKSGSVVILDSMTGAVRALCVAPRFDPNRYGSVKDLSVYINQVVSNSWEPGSVFKAITMAAALEHEAVTPETTYVDTGSVTLDKETIKNADNKVYGEQTMTQVLMNSINTGAVYAQRKVGKDIFRAMVEAFGFGRKTGIELTAENTGNISSLSKKGEIYAATASFGQGITVTPLQMAAAFGAIANGGVLMKPYIVEEIVSAKGQRSRTAPREVGRVISPRTAVVLRAMLTTVVEEGHGKRAGVPGYWVAGKTGTAQVARQGGKGYDPHKTVGSFIGFGPVDAPRFVILVKIDEPSSVKFAESTAAPVFGELADFLFQYYRIKPTREIIQKK